MELRTLTLEQLQEIQQQKLQELVEFAGNMSHLSYMLDIPSNTIQGWVNRGRISKDGAKKVEAHITLGGKFKACDLRPDISIDK